MRILELHCDYVKWSARQKAFKGAEDIADGDKNHEHKLDNVLVVFASIEEGDDEKTAANAASEVKKNYDEVKAQNVLVYPYAHLSSSLAKPVDAVRILNELLKEVRKFSPQAVRSQFGWYKAFELKCKGHPLSELSKTITNNMQAAKVIANAPAGDAMLEYANAFAEKAKGAKEGGAREKTQRTGAVILAKACHNAIGASLVDVTLTQDGFYADFECKPLNAIDLEKIATEVKAIIAAKEKITAAKHAEADAIKLFAGNKYATKAAGVMKSFNAIDLGGFHAFALGSTLTDSHSLHSVVITKHGGSYLNNKDGNPALQRVYAIAFATAREQESYEKLLAEAEKRDHRKLGSQLDLYSFHEESPGNAFYHPNGMVLRNQLEKLWREEHEKAGYSEVRAPIVLSDELWRRSGHYDHYAENMYFTSIDGRQNALKPMNCPGHILIYANSLRSYRELPVRLCEMGLVHRHELSGVLSGLFRVRSFTQDDAHLFVTPEQIDSEIKSVITLFKRFYEKFGFAFEVELSTKPEKAMGDPALWVKAEAALANAMKELGMKYEINAGDGAFYGPKLDFKLTDAIGRKWQCGTIQLDFQMPERFDLHYVAADGTKKRPVMLHRVVYGSIDRFMGVLVEHYAGAFPVWLAPIQAVIVPMADDNVKYAEKVYRQLHEAGVRAKLDDSRGTMEAKVREATVNKTPFILVVGGNEEKAGTVSIRSRDGKVERDVKTTEFAHRIEKASRERSE